RGWPVVGRVELHARLVGLDRHDAPRDRVAVLRDVAHLVERAVDDPVVIVAGVTGLALHQRIRGAAARKRTEVAIVRSNGSRNMRRADDGSTSASRDAERTDMDRARAALVVVAHVPEGVVVAGVDHRRREVLPAVTPALGGGAVDQPGPGEPEGARRIARGARGEPLPGVHRRAPDRIADADVAAAVHRGAAHPTVTGVGGEGALFIEDRVARALGAGA